MAALGVLLGMPGWAQAPPPSTPAEAPAEGREFCHQSVSFRVMPRESVVEAYRSFVGIWSDAAWTPQLCAALVVEAVTPQGTATITYAFGPTGATARGAGGILHGTGVIRGGELKFQNSDGTQFAFKPFYSDLDGHLVTPKGDAYEAIFKRNY